MPYRHTLRVRFQECDPQGVVYFARYPEYFDIAITELWRERLGGFGAMVDGGVDMVVAEQSVRYLAPARFDELVDVDVTVAHLGTTSLGWTYAVTREGTTLAEGAVRHVFVDAAGTGTHPIPDDLRAALAAV